MAKPLKIYVVKTDKCSFISDIIPNDSYNYLYHKSKIVDLLFNGQKPEPTFFKNWMKIDGYPTKVQRWETPPTINRRYELKDPWLESEKLPLVMPQAEVEGIGLSEDTFDNLYQFKSDAQDPVLIDVEFVTETIFEVENFEMPSVFDYNILKKGSLGFPIETKFTNLDIQHQMFDKLLFPEVVLASRPASIASHELYAIIRQYVIDNIDNKTAKITSNYDFCFEVQKLVPLFKPQNFIYRNLFARTKHEREKLRTGTQTHENVVLFEMTHDKAKYEKYTVLPDLTEPNEFELKKRLDEILEGLIFHINAPLTLCEHCNGTGHIGEITKLMIGDIK